jgi:hypothetical protein
MTVAVVVLATAARVSHMCMEYEPKHVRVRVEKIVCLDKHVPAKPDLSLSLSLSRLS